MKKEEPKYFDFHLRDEDINVYDFEGDIDATIRFLQSLKVKYASYQNLRLEIGQVGSGYDASVVNFELRGKRQETEEEFNSRLQVESQVKESRAKEVEKKKKADLKELERLAKKYKKTLT